MIAMKYYTSTTQFNCGIDLHARQMHVCVLDRDGKKLVHTNIRTNDWLETKAKFISQVMSGDMTVRRLEDMDSAALTYPEFKAIASGNPLVIEKAQVDAELIRLTRLRSAHAEERHRIRSSLRHSHQEVKRGQNGSAIYERI